MANLRVDKITSTETFETTGSVQFDGNGDHLDVGSAGDFNYLHNGAASFTAEFWVYPQLVNSRQIIFSTGGNSSTTGFVIRIMSSGSGGSSNGYFVSAQTSKGSDGNYLYWDSDPTRLDADTWYHIAMVYDHTNNTLKIYVNGKLTNSGFRRETGTFGSHSTSNSTHSLHIGEEPYNNSKDLKGHLSNLRILNGVKLYTSNFKPPMRELEVVPGTVLLACQSKTDATLEKTGKTITVNGNAVASELTPGILTPVPKAGGGSAITGSVEFSGSTDYLTVPNTEDLRLADSDFTIEFWATISKVDSSYTAFALFENSSALRSYLLEVRSNGAVRFEWWYNGSSSNNITTGTGVIVVNQWNHYAVSRNGATLKLFINGVEVGSSNVGTNSFFNNTATAFMIGGMFQSAVHTQKWQGNISNFRINKGTALYTHNFIPPTRKLKKVPGTSLLCCQDSNDPTQEATGKTISLNGLYTYDTVVTSGITTAPTPSNFTPQVGDDRKVTFEGVTKINSNAYFYLPTGDTITRDSRSGRGLFGGGKDPSGRTNCIDYINISSEGNGLDFGDLILARDQLASCSSSTRGLWAGGDPGTNVINFVTIATRSNAVDFGDLVVAEQSFGGAANHTRGLFFGGSVKTIQYVTIASTGDAIDFGDLVRNEHDQKGCGSPTRGIIIIKDSSIEFVTFASTGNATDFGDTTGDNSGTAACSDSTRAIRGGGTGPQNAIEYITIASTGDAKDFGDLTLARNALHAVSNSVRGVFGGGDTPSPFTNTIDYVTIQSTGNAQDFGDLSVPRENGAGCSDSHGGLG